MSSSALGHGLLSPPTVATRTQGKRWLGMLVCAVSSHKLVNLNFFSQNNRACLTRECASEMSSPGHHDPRKVILGLGQCFGVTSSATAELLATSSRPCLEPVFCVSFVCLHLPVSVCCYSQAGRLLGGS